VVSAVLLFAAGIAAGIVQTQLLRRQAHAVVHRGAGLPLLIALTISLRLGLLIGAAAAITAGLLPPVLAGLAGFWLARSAVLLTAARDVIHEARRGS
jgi:hypothetical protein